MACPIDTDQKRLARFFLNRKMKNLWGGAKGIHIPEGSSLVLAGNEASEIGGLKHYLGLPAKQTFFVDTNRAGLDVVKKAWSKAQTFQGPVKDAIKTIQGNFNFINLDFCGYPTNEVLESVEAAAGRIQDRGVVAYTFVRGRESANTPNWDAAVQAAKRAIHKDPRYRELIPNSDEWMDTVRFVGYTRLLQERLGKNFELVFRIKYHSISNMGIVALQRVGMASGAESRAWAKELVTHRSPEEETGVIHDVDLRTTLREIALDLRLSFTTAQVAQILHLPTLTVSAWQAHKTRGTYWR